MEVLQRIDEVLLDLDVQSVLHLCQLTHGLPDIDQSETWSDGDSLGRWKNTLAARAAVCAQQRRRGLSAADCEDGYLSLNSVSLPPLVKQTAEQTSGSLSAKTARAFFTTCCVLEGIP